MLKILFSASFFKVIVIFLNLIIPAIVIRFYSAHDFGTYSYLLAYAIVVSILQNGVTASFRNVISSLSKIEALDYLFYTVSRIIRPLVLLIFLGISCIVLMGNDDAIYTKVTVFILLSLVNILYPLVASYYDAKDKTVKFVSYEIIFSLISLILVYLFSVYGVSVFIVCILTANYRGLYAVTILICKNIKMRKTRLKSSGFKRYDIFGLNDILFSSIQVVNVLNTLLFMNMLARHYGIIGFGVFSLYYRFISFPQQIVGFSSSLIWIKFRKIYSENIIFSYNFVCKLFVTFTVAVIVWAVLVQLSMDKIVEIYSSKRLNYPGEMYLLNGMICIILLKDFSSIILNATSIYKVQLILNVLLLVLNLALLPFISTISFDSFYMAIISVFSLSCLIINMYFIKTRVLENVD